TQCTSIFVATERRMEAARRVVLSFGRRRGSDLSTELMIGTEVMSLPVKRAAPRKLSGNQRALRMCRAKTARDTSAKQRNYRDSLSLFSGGISDNTLKITPLGT